MDIPDNAQPEEDPLDRNPDLWIYRKRTVGLLRRYMRFSIETGRLPSLVGREFFRAKVTYYTATTFEDRVIFVRDVEKCLNRLEHWDQQLIARIILQEYGQEQAARILHCSRSKVARRLPEVLDLLSEDFLRVGLLSGLPSRREFSQ
jgi:DNA-directed RNA polymerase specialized sigma24 family protein